MRLISTKTKSINRSFKEALMEGMPIDNGLFVPAELPLLPLAFTSTLEQYSFQELGLFISQAFLGDEIGTNELEQIIQESLDFPIHISTLDESTHVLELYHGPSFAFKDVGARFMARCMAHFNTQENRDLHILVATSGDTGGAVAMGFDQVPGIQVTLLYPSGKVSPLQEKQLTTQGNNIHALEVEGTFDDCQYLVKHAFLDQALRRSIRISSANSINIARLIPQTFYYWEAYKQIKQQGDQFVFSVPSGNLGNLTAGLMAQRMGLPAHHFVAASNANEVFPKYLQTGQFNPMPSKETLSNAMDVGNPSNFARIAHLYGSTWNIAKEHIDGYRFSDAETKAVMRETYARYKYIFEPHGAIGYMGWRTYQKANPETTGIILETAHPAKFKETIDAVLNTNIPLPKGLQNLLSKEKRSMKIKADYEALKEHLLSLK
jgi:threonine synthase